MKDICLDNLFTFLIVIPYKSLYSGVSPYNSQKENYWISSSEHFLVKFDKWLQNICPNLVPKQNMSADFILFSPMEFIYILNKLVIRSMGNNISLVFVSLFSWTVAKYVVGT